MAEATPRNWGRIVLIGVLVVSLIGNAVAIGAALRLRALRNDLMGTEAVQLPRETRAALRDAIKANRAELLPQLRALAQLRARIITDATTQPFDRAKLQAEMTELRTGIAALLVDTQAIVLDTLEAQAQK